MFYIGLYSLLYIHLQDTNSMRELPCAQVYSLTPYFYLNSSKNISGKTQTESQSDLTNISLPIVFCVYTLNFRFEFSCFFFYLGFLSRTLTIYRTAAEGGGYLFGFSLRRFTDIQTLAGRLLQRAHLFFSFYTPYVLRVYVIVPTNLSACDGEGNKNC